MNKKKTNNDLITTYTYGANYEAGEELVITDDQDALSAILHLTRFIQQLEKGNFREIELLTDSKGHPYIENLTDFRHVVSLAQRDFSIIESSYPRHELNPWAKAFLNVIHQMQVSGVNFDAASIRSLGAEAAAERVNRVLLRLRSEICSESFRKCAKVWKRRATRIRARFQAILKVALQKHAKLLIIRIDFGLKSSATLNPKTPQSPAIKNLQSNLADRASKPQDANLHFDEIDAARERVLRRVRNLYGAHLLGYVWRLEYGARKGFHYHCVFILNGNRHRRDVHIANTIGKLWEHHAPYGLGIFRNCNANRSDYKFPATGLVRYHESGHWKGLNLIGDYFSKSDFLVSLKLPKPHRTFGSSLIPAELKTKRGPRRRLKSQETDERTINQKGYF